MESNLKMMMSNFQHKIILYRHVIFNVRRAYIVSIALCVIIVKLQNSRAIIQKKQDNALM